MKDPIQVLDHGYVRLIDFLGKDEDIISAARMSTKRSFVSWDPYWRCKKCDTPWFYHTNLAEGPCLQLYPGARPGACCDNVSMDKMDAEKFPKGDVGTLEYLWAHKHATPFEMCELVIEVKAPIMVFREWHRHRTQCLAGDTEVYFEIRNRAKSGRHGPRKVKLKDLYQRWQPTKSVVRPDRQRNPYFKRERTQQMLLRCLNEDTKTFVHTSITDVIYSGKKEMYEVELEDGKHITCSADHRFLFEKGWASLRDGAGMRHEESNLITWAPDTRMYVNGALAYRDADWLKARYPTKRLEEIATEAGVSTHAVRKWLKKHGLQQRSGDFQTGHIPWNQNRSYRTGHVVTDEHKASIRAARSGAKSNFWKGGVTSERANIARWTREQAPKVHAKFDYTCQLCRTRGGKLHAHHVIPVWADETKARDFENLVTLCHDCHKQVQGRELDYAPRFTGQPLPAIYLGKSAPTSKGKPRLIAKLMRIKNIRYVGIQDCYDLSVAGPYHNFVADGVVTHNSYNEMSARYTQMPNEHYVPEYGRVQKQSATNKQGSGEALDLTVATDFLLELQGEQELVYQHYEKALEHGVAKEVARLNTPVSRYSVMRAKANLRNWLGFLNLRLRPGAQWEIRQYAQAVADIIKTLWPRTWSLFEEYDLYAASFSRTELAVLKKLIGQSQKGMRDTAKDLGLSGRRVDEFVHKVLSGGGDVIL